MLLTRLWHMINPRISSGNSCRRVLRNIPYTVYYVLMCERLRWAGTKFSERGRVQLALMIMSKMRKLVVGRDETLRVWKPTNLSVQSWNLSPRRWVWHSHTKDEHEYLVCKYVNFRPVRDTTSDRWWPSECVNTVPTMKIATCSRKIDCFPKILFSSY
jgi:hypothetical protein